MSSRDNLFTEGISENNCVCVAFSEPAKLSHKSILLPGTLLPPPSLKVKDVALIGEILFENWHEANENLEVFIRHHSNELEKIGLVISFL